MALPLYLATFTLKLTNPRQFMDQLLLNGVHLNLSSHHRAQRRQPWVAVDGTDHWRKSASLVCPLSN
jgi:hypothetical protein